jgi:hypothetical protein
MSDNPLTITIPEHLKGRLFFTYEEFGSLAGKCKHTVRNWVRLGWLKYTQFSPRCRMIPIAELKRLRDGKLMEQREE